MDALRDYPPEFAQAFQETFSCLFAINIRFWFHDATFFTKYWRFLYIGPCVVLFAASATVDVWLLLRAGRLAVVEIAYRLPPYLVIIQGVLKGVVVVPRAREVARLVHQLGAVWRTEDATFSAHQRALRTKLLRRVTLCNKVIYWGALVGTAQYLVTPLVQTLADTAERRLLPLAARYPFDPTASTASWTLYLSVYAFQSYSMFLCVMLYIGVELLMVSVCALLAVEFKLLRVALLVGARADRAAPAALLHVVRGHQELVRLSQQFDDIFNKLVFVDLLFVGGTTCFFRFAGQFSKGTTDMVNNYVAMVSSQLYVLCFCYYGEQLTGASLSVADAAYDSPWYKANNHYRIIIIMIITRSQRPCCLTSLKYAPVTLSLFTTVMSTTWSYCSLMNSVYEDQE